MMPVNDCTDCDGVGRTHDVYEDVWWACEGCERSGRMTSCVECGDPLPLPSAEQHSYRCADCLVEAERGDRQAMVEELRRMG